MNTRKTQDFDKNKTSCVNCGKPITIDGKNINFSCDCLARNKLNVTYTYKN